MTFPLFLCDADRGLQQAHSQFVAGYAGASGTLRHGTTIAAAEI